LDMHFDAGEPQPCVGLCGYIAPEEIYNWYGVKKDEETGEWEAFPVCDRCFHHPEHRKQNLKMHFFAREMKAQGLARAGSTNIG